LFDAIFPIFGRMKARFTTLLLLFLLLALSASAQIRLPKLISDGLVLQREQALNIWGWSAPGEEIHLQFRASSYHTTADEAGNWEMTLPPQDAGGPDDMLLKGSNEILVKDILVGDVWVCAGQSNMVLPMERVKERYADDIAAAEYPEIRNFFIPTATRLQGPETDLPAGQWKSANPEDVLGFGAVSYFFAREIYETTRIPIGLINASVGGTPIEAWISEDGLLAFPNLMEQVAQNKDSAYVHKILLQSRANRLERTEKDKGLLEPLKWYDPEYRPKGWHNIHIPGYWEDQGLNQLNGTVWYRKEIQVPASMTHTTAKLFMGRIIDADHIYVNGTEVGHITYQYPPRRYSLAPGILKPGKNLIVIRVSNYSGKGGFVPDKPYYLTANGEELDLKGDWQYKVGDVFKPVQNPSKNFSFQNQPTSLYNAMIAPISPQSIRGILWYQGESNTHHPGPYKKLLPALIRDWRSAWGQDSLPFLYVQLANYMDRDFLPVESHWAELRDAQLQALSLPNTAMAVSIDLGEWNDIHPLNKKDVGYRLSLGARHLSYGEKGLVYAGPLYDSHEIRGDTVVLHFNHIGSGLVSIDDEPLCQFAIAGADQNFEWAEAKIVGRTVEVSHKNIPDPAFVRYAWSNNPLGANLYNREGLPASPFQLTVKK